MVMTRAMAFAAAVAARHRHRVARPVPVVAAVVPAGRQAGALTVRLTPRITLVTAACRAESHRLAARGQTGPRGPRGRSAVPPAAAAPWPPRPHERNDGDGRRTPRGPAAGAPANPVAGRADSPVATGREPGGAAGSRPVRTPLVLASHGAAASPADAPAWTGRTTRGAGMGADWTGTVSTHVPAVPRVLVSGEPGRPGRLAQDGRPGGAAGADAGAVPGRGPARVPGWGEPWSPPRGGLPATHGPDVDRVVEAVVARLERRALAARERHGRP